MDYQHKTRGIGLLELLLALVIIVALIIMATRYYQQASEDLQVTEATQIVSTIINASFKWVEGQPGFTTNQGVSICALVNAGELPQDWCPNGKSQKKQDPWGGIVDVKGTSSTQILITLPYVPTTSCNSISDIMGQQEVESHCSSDGYVAKYPISP